MSATSTSKQQVAVGKHQLEEKNATRYEWEAPAGYSSGFAGFIADGQPSERLADAGQQRQAGENNTLLQEHLLHSGEQQVFSSARSAESFAPGRARPSLKGARIFVYLLVAGAPSWPLRRRCRHKHKAGQATSDIYHKSGLQASRIERHKQAAIERLSALELSLTK